jgi:C-terminal processing protease CtpA/Prc
VIILIYNSPFTVAQPSEEYQYNKKFTPQELQADLEYLAEMLEKAHPGLFWYTSPAEFHKEITRLRESLTEPLTENQFLQKVASLNALIKCVHTDIKPSKQFQSLWGKEARFLPLNIMKVQGKYYVAENMSSMELLTVGTEILSIDGIAVEDIVNALLPYIPADGDNQTRKFHALKKNFSRYYSLFKNPFQKEYRVKIKKIDGREVENTIQGISRAEFLKKRKQQVKQKGHTPPATLTFMNEESVAILTISTFRYDLFARDSINFAAFMEDSFQTIRAKNIQNLIIDVRDNGGGYSEYGAIVNSYLADSAFQYCERMVLTNDTLMPDIKYDIPATFRGFPEGVQTEVRGNDTIFTWKKHSVFGWRDNQANAFTGNVYILINGGCVSTTSEFSSIARAQKQGIFVGEEVGGSYPGDCGGILGWVELPNTKVRARIAMVQYNLDVNGVFSRHGTLPDIPVEPSIDDIRSGNDAVLQATLELIQNKANHK